MELYSKEELLKELKKEYSCGGECDHCPEVLDAGSCAVLRCIRRIIDNAPTVEANSIIDGLNNEIDDLSENLAWYINERNRLLKERRPQGEWIANPLGDYVCNKCSWVIGKFERNFCPNCGVKMKGGAEND